MKRLALAALLAASAACKSSAPYAVPAAIVNTTLAAGAAAAQRAGGGCVAICTNGTVCNPRTGFCEKAASPRDLCEPLPGGGERCVPLDIREMAKDRPAPAVPAGVSPATGTVQPPPAEASPRGP